MGAARVFLRRHSHGATGRSLDAQSPFFAGKLREQAARVSQRTAYFHLGNLIEVGETDRIFTNPLHKMTEDYIPGRIG